MNQYSEIVELNNNSNLKFSIGEPNTNIIMESNKQFEVINNYMSKDFYIPNVQDRKIIVKFYGFPTDEDGYCLASYQTSLSEDNIFGIEVGTSFDKAEEKLLSYGYFKIDNIFTKGVVQIKFRCDKDNNIINIEISLQSKYLGNRLY